MSYTDKALAVMDRLGLNRPAEGGITPLTSFTPSPESRDTRSAAPPPTIRALTRALAEDFAESGQLVKVHMPGVPDPVWMVPAVEDAVRLWATDGVTRGHIFTANELADMASIPNVTPETWRAVTLAKIVFGGDVAEVRAR